MTYQVTQSSNPGRTVAWDFFWRSYNKNTAKMMSQGNVRTERVYLPANLNCQQALDYARATKAIPVGTHNNGCFEVQNDRGSWIHEDGKKIDMTTPRKAAKVEWLPF
jgi:hypothetical protein